MAAELGDAIHLSQPVRGISQDDDGVTVRSEDMVVRARRVVVTVPISIPSQIIYEPMLPVDRSFLLQRMPLGAVFKIALVYDEPFWRADGLSGQSFGARRRGEPDDRLLHGHRESRDVDRDHRGARGAQAVQAH